VVVPAVVKSMFVAHLARGLEGAIKVAADDTFRVFTLNAEHYLDTLVGKNIRRSGPHASGQDHGRALLAQPHGKDPATVLRRGAKKAVTDGATVLVHRVEGERLSAAKVFAESTFV